MDAGRLTFMTATGATTKDGRELDLARDDSESRYTATVGGTVAAVAEFMATPELVILTHTETDPAFEARASRPSSCAGRSTTCAARAARAAAVPVRQGVHRRHPGEYGDLVYASRTTVVHD
jgi:hypothetical protein